MELNGTYTNQHIYLDVGGTHFKTTFDTLSKVPYFDSASHFSDGLLSSTKIDPYFIDRDPDLFRHVLRLLRDPKYQFPLEYVSELEFYGIGINQEQEKTETKSTPYETTERNQFADLYKTFNNGVDYDTVITNAIEEQTKIIINGIQDYYKYGDNMLTNIAFDKDTFRALDRKTYIKCNRYRDNMFTIIALDIFQTEKAALGTLSDALNNRKTYPCRITVDVYQKCNTSGCCRNYYHVKTIYSTGDLMQVIIKDIDIVMISIDMPLPRLTNVSKP